MEITFATRKLETVFSSQRSRVRMFGAEVAGRLTRRLTELHAAPTLDAMRNLPGRCHELHGDLAGQLALDVARNHRLLFRPTNAPPPTKPDGGLDWRAVEAITILGVEDYHGD